MFSNCAVSLLDYEAGECIICLEEMLIGKAVLYQM